MANKTKKVKKGAIDTVTGTANETFNFLKKKIKLLFIDILKIEIGAFAIAIAVILIGLLFMFGLGLFSSLPLDSENPDISEILPLIAGLLVTFLFAGILSTIFQSVTYNAVDMRMKNARVMITERFQRNFIPMLSLMILIGIVYLIIFIPGIIAIVSGSMTGVFLAFTLLFISILILIVFLFFAQFAVLELLINERGPWESIMNSLELVKKNFWAVIAFDIAYWIISMALGSVMAFISYSIQILFFMLMMVNPLAGILIMVLILLIVEIIYVAGMKAIMLPFMYKFWKNIQVK